MRVAGGTPCTVASLTFPDPCIYSARSAVPGTTRPARRAGA
jgi:hypothetical protein